MDFNVKDYIKNCEECPYKTVLRDIADGDTMYCFCNRLNTIICNGKNASSHKLDCGLSNDDVKVAYKYYFKTPIYSCRQCNLFDNHDKVCLADNRKNDTPGWPGIPEDCPGIGKYIIAEIGGIAKASNYHHSQKSD